MIPVDKQSPMSAGGNVARVISYEPPNPPILAETPEEIRLEMARTRGQLNETITAIQDRLEPRRLKKLATNRAREATIGRMEDLVSRVEQSAGEARNGLVDTIRHNPIPAALVGVGLAWMFFSPPDTNRAGARSYSRHQIDPNRGGYRGYGGFQVPSISDNVPSVGQIKDTAGRLVDQAGSQVQQVGQQAQELGQQAQDLGGQARDQVGKLGSQVQGTVQHFGDQAQDQVEGVRTDVEGQVQTFSAGVQEHAQRVSTTFDRVLRVNPLSMGVVAIAIGAAVGLATPEIPYEEELIGGAREQVKQKAQEAAHGALENAQKIADQVQIGATPAY